MTLGKHAVKKDKRSPIAIVLSAVFFLMLAVALFVYANMAIGFYGTKQSKGAFNAFDDLQENSVDVMLVGSSATSRYFIPGKAYNDEGFASFELAAPSMPLSFVDNIMDLVQETQDPKLYVVELRNVLDGYRAVDEVSVRKTVDSIKLTKRERFEMIDEALDIMSEHAEEGSYDDNALNYYFPVVKYHNRLTAPDDENHLKAKELLLRGSYNNMQGFQYSDPTLTKVAQEKPHYVDYSAELATDIEEIVGKLLDYCDELDADVIFTFSPFIMSEEKSAMANAITDYVESRGYTCLNFNSFEMADKLELDWSNDFYNTNHCNFQGSEKFTSCLAKYISSHYDLPDRRGDGAYAAWEASYKKYEAYVADGILYESDENVSDE